MSNMGAHTLIMLTCLLVNSVMSATNEGKSKLTAKIGDLAKQIEMLNGKVAGLDGKVTALNGKVDGLHDIVTGLVGKVAGLDSKVEGLDGKIAGVQNTCMSGKTSSQIWYKNLSDQLSNVNNSMQEHIDALQTSCANPSDSEAPTNTSCGQTTPSIDCSDLLRKGLTASGVYTIYPAGIPGGVSVVCDMETDCGGWTLIQRRDTDTDFYKTYAEYESGFGNKVPTGNFWLGNKYIHAITRQGFYTLRVDLRGDAASNFERRAAFYQNFTVADAASSYKLSVGTYSYDRAYVDPGDSLSYHKGMKFTAKDVDNDVWSGNCAQQYRGAWWHNACHYSNLNGAWGSAAFGQGTNWYTFLGHYRSMTFTRMMIRRSNCHV